MKRSYRMVVSAGLGVAVLAWGVPAALAQPRAAADLRADVNRDGRVSVSGDADEHGEDQAGVQRGALFLSNVDDDQSRCKVVDGSGQPVPDADIVACRDGADTVVNGPQDENDLARLRSVPLSLPSGAEGTAAVTGPGAGHTHLFVKRAAGWRLLGATDRLTGAELERGIELGIEGTDIVRDAKVWDGRATVTLSVTAGGQTTTDAVTLRAAPVLTHHHLQRAQQIMASRLTREQAEALGDPTYAPASATFADDLKKVAGMPVFEFTETGDLFPQDRFEAMYTSMPGAGGKPQAMRVLFLSHQQKMSVLELYSKLRGPGVGIVRLDPDDYEAGLADTLDSMGNLETIPPYSYNGRSYPAGRVIMGVGRKPPAEGPGPGGAVRAAADDTIEPSPAVQTFLRSQNMQDPLLLDSSWTFVEHVDEFIQFLPANTPRGWRVAVADPEAGMKLLRDAQGAGYGGVELLSGGKADGNFRTIDQYLGDKDQILAKANALAARKIAANVAVIKRETGVRDSEIVHVPTLFGDAGLVLGPGEDSDYVYPLYAEIPAAINGVVLDRDRYLSTRQWGPVINGKDIVAEAVSATYRAAGMNVTFVDGWHLHRGGGQIHCGTNVLRDASQPWWQPQR